MLSFCKHIPSHQILMLYLYLWALVLGVNSSKANAEPWGGALRDSEERISVIYAEAGNVYLKICNSRPIVSPLTRNCLSRNEVLHMSAKRYLYTLPYDVGGYDISDEVLTWMASTLADARAALAAGDMKAQETIDRFEPLHAITRTRQVYHHT